MKRALEVKNIMIAVNNNNTHQTNISLQPSNSPNRVGVCPSEKKLRGGKIVKKINGHKTQRRFSFNPNASPPRQQLSMSRQLEQQKCFTPSRCRYDIVVQEPEEMIQHSYSNMKIQSLQFQGKNCSDAQSRTDQKASKTSMNWCEMFDQRKSRIKSQPNPNNFKQDIMRRVEKKVDFMKKMTTQGQTHFPIQVKGLQSPQRSKLFNFDRLYDHCLKNINKGINGYQKDLARNKDRRYYQLKIQSTMLSSELKSMRKGLMRKKETEGSNLGVIGNFIDVAKVQKSQKLSSQRLCESRANTSHCKRKLQRITKQFECKNPFTVPQLHGWQIKCQKNEDFIM